MAEHCPLKRCATPDDVARVVAFLASEDGGWVNGKHHKSIRLFRPAFSSIYRPSHHHLGRLFAIDAGSRCAYAAADRWE